MGFNKLTLESLWVQTYKSKAHRKLAIKMGKTSVVEQECVHVFQRVKVLHVALNVLTLVVSVHHTLTSVKYCKDSPVLSRHGSSSSELCFPFDPYFVISYNTINAVRASFWPDEMHIGRYSRKIHQRWQILHCKP